jgi:hypothetical protein
MCDSSNIIMATLNSDSLSLVNTVAVKTHVSVHSDFAGVSVQIGRLLYKSSWSLRHKPTPYEVRKMKTKGEVRVGENNYARPMTRQSLASFTKDILSKYPTVNSEHMWYKLTHNKLVPWKNKTDIGCLESIIMTTYRKQVIDPQHPAYDITGVSYGVYASYGIPSGMIIGRYDACGSLFEWRNEKALERAAIACYPEFEDEYYAAVGALDTMVFKLEAHSKYNIRGSPENNMSFINDPRGTHKHRANVRAEHYVCFDEGVAWPVIAIRAIVDIECDTEVLMDYGRRYWDYMQGVRYGNYPFMHKMRTMAKKALHQKKRPKHASKKGEDGMFDVDRILKQNGDTFLVKWTGFKKSTWEPLANIQECQAFLDWRADEQL